MQNNCDGLLSATSQDNWSVKDLTLHMGNFKRTGIKAYLCQYWDVVSCKVINLKHWGVMAQGATATPASYWRVDGSDFTMPISVCASDRDGHTAVCYRQPCCLEAQLNNQAHRYS
jgi:hypothetical protein